MIYCTITIDTECDKGPGWTVQHPLRFTSVRHAIPERLTPIFQAFGARPTYLISSEVLRDRASVDALDWAAQQGAELGTHLHGEFEDPAPDWQAKRTSVMQNSYPPSLEYRKLKSLTHRFQDVFNRSPRSFRAGRFGLSQTTFASLSHLGYLVDSSVAPFSHWKDQVHFFGAPQQPYFPHKTDPLRQGSFHLLEVPVSIGLTWWEYIPPFVLWRVPRTRFFWGVVLKYFKLKSRFAPTWLRPSWATESQMNHLVDHIIHKEKQNSRPILLNMMFHSVEYASNCSPYSLSEGDVQRFSTRLSAVLDHMAANSVRFITLSEAYEVYSA
jgi:hypothetical protein